VQEFDYLGPRSTQPPVCAAGDLWPGPSSGFESTAAGQETQSTSMTMTMASDAGIGSSTFTQRSPVTSPIVS